MNILLYGNNGKDQNSLNEAMGAEQNENAPGDALCRAVRQLLDQGALDEALAAGTRAPLFVLRDTAGSPVALERLLRKGHVVITFFRGLWCPECTDDLRAIDALRDQFAASDAQVIAISQQSPKFNRKTRQLHELRFPVLSDSDGGVARRYGLQWTIPDELRPALLESGTNIPHFNDDSSWSLPMAARYIVSRDGIISFAEVTADPQRRSPPSDLLRILNRLNDE